MQIAGFTFIRNAIKYDYPVKEAILSILPICDMVFVAVGNCTDATRELVASIDPKKITIIDTVWDERLKEGGKVLADETNKVFQAIPAFYDWCFYIQGDEVVHEQYLPAIKASMLQYKDDQNVDGLLFNYQHFYGSYDYVGDSGKWYRHEIRVIKNNKNIYSYLDAQGFRKDDNKKLSVKQIPAFINHYGWVREPKAMLSKSHDFQEFWSGDNWEIQKQKNYEGNFDYSQIDSLAKFTGTHPAVMKARIANMNWKFDRDLSYNKLPLKYRIKNILEKLTGKRFFEYENYKKI